jgi:hypothetical protein
VARSERLNKLGDSWFSPKAIEVVPDGYTLGGRALYRLGGREDLPNRSKLRIPRSESIGATRRVIKFVVERETTQTVR